MDTSPKCPQCGEELEKVTYPGGMLNREQWDSVRAGDWVCRKCPDNGRGNKRPGVGYAYFWDREVLVTSEPQFAWSYDKEFFHGRYDSREEARAAGPSDSEIFTGEITEPPAPECFLDADMLIEHIQCQDDFSCEGAEDWPICTKDQKDELTREVQAVFAAWIRRHKLHPTHYSVDTSTIEEHPPRA